MADKPKVRTGTKIEAAEAATLDPKKMGTGVPAANEPEVEGQYLYVDYISCPWCSNVIRMQLSSSEYVWWRCQMCGNAYRA